MKTSRNLRLLGMVLALATGSALTVHAAEAEKPAAAAKAKAEIPEAVTKAAQALLKENEKLEGIHPKKTEEGVVYVVAISGEQGKKHRVVLDATGKKVSMPKKDKEEKKKSESGS